MEEDTRCLDNGLLKMEVPLSPAKVGRKPRKKDYICIICGRFFSDSTKLKNHFTFVHENSEAFKCESCSKSFVDEKTLRTHYVLLHSGLKETYESEYLKKKEVKIDVDELEKKRHKCSDCGKAFVKPFLLKRHVEAVHLKLKSHQCEFCDKSYSQIRDLSFHRSRVHPEEALANGEELKIKQRNYECNLCSKKFDTPARRQRHVTQVHWGVRAYNCPHCDKSYKAKQDALYHIDSVHGGVKLNKPDPGECFSKESSSQEQDSNNDTTEEEIDIKDEPFDPS